MIAGRLLSLANLRPLTCPQDASLAQKSRQLPRGARARPGGTAGRDALGLVNITPTAGSISVERYSSTAVPASGSRPWLHGCAKRGRVSDATKL